MKIGYPYKSLDRSTWKYCQQDKEWKNSITSIAYGAHDRAPISDPLRGAWEHWQNNNIPIAYAHELLPKDKIRPK